MPKRGQRDLAKEKYWRKIIEQFKESGLSGQAFCGLKKLKYTTFADWRREIAARDAEKQSGRRSKFGRASRVKSSSNGIKAASSQPANFAEINVVSDKTEETKIVPVGTIDIILTSGITLRVPQTSSLKFTSSLLSVLEGK